MPSLFRHSLVALVALLLLPSSHAAEAGSPLTLFYTNPAVKWTEALPIGNGRLGAMVFGGLEREHLQLNESTLWAGGPYDPANTNALAALPAVRQLVFDGQYDAASQLISRKMMAVPLQQMPYETLGDLFLDFGTNTVATDYRRDLNLDTAVASVSYTANGVHFKREMFASPVDQVMVIRLTADRPGQISFTASLRTPHTATVLAHDNSMEMFGDNNAAHGLPPALNFMAKVSLREVGGQSKPPKPASNAMPTSPSKPKPELTKPSRQYGPKAKAPAPAPKSEPAPAPITEITVSNADSVTLFIAAATNYKNYHDVSGDPQALVRSQIRDVLPQKFDALLARHIAAYQTLFRRVSLDLGESDAMKLPTDVRIAQFADGNDPQLAALYFQFARYLLISCSRPGGQPATLQGLWNNSLTPPWDSKYTININTEMNYWPAETCNLAECVDPLTQMVLELAETGARTAKVEYGARGWVAHHNTDLWRATAPIDGPQYGMWPLGGAWLCQNLWEHYRFSEDKAYLTKIYPAMKGAAQFFLDTLVEEPTHHWLVTCPSLSPENLNPAATNTSITAGPTMDLEILRDLFDHCIEAAAILDIDHQFAAALSVARGRLAPLQIGSSGQLQEWLQDIDLQSHDLHHRHVSHLYGLFPSAQIDVLEAPELAAAAKKSLEIRGDQATGWATAWRMNLWARLHDGDHAYAIFQFLLSPARTYPDLFDAHPPFQIDGNFGGASGIAEMLLQSQNQEIQLLPALPHAWPTGSVTGLRARGGFTVDLIWKDGQLASASIHSLNGNPVRLRYGQNTKFVQTKKSQILQWNGQ